MRLEKLEIFGFKSFPERTVLKFEPGITAIVGPNGSGKSNIFDAIKWVLGEQSVKELRGSKMQDVIFSGTETRPPLGMAEVSLTLSNTDGKLSFPEKEIVITRRIFSSGENEYFINHNPVRLKDITDLLLGSGVGVDFYSIVGQGKIDLILSSKPEERRIIFDEASGILKYKLQKKETLRKLEETENNLLRIKDIISEVKRQINSLERQANKAKRYKELLEELKNKEIVLANFNVKKYEDEKQALLKKLDAEISMESSLKEEYQKVLSQLEDYENELKKEEEAIFKIKESIINIEHLIQANQKEKEISEERIGELNQFKERLIFEIQMLNQKIAQTEQEINNFNEENKRIKEMYAQKIDSIKQKEAQLDALEKEKLFSKNNIEKAKNEILELNILRTKLKNEIIDLNTNFKVIESRKRRLNIEEEKSKEERNNIQNKLEEIKKELEELKFKLEEKNKIKSALQCSIKEDQDNLETLKNEILALDKERVSLISQREFLEKLNLNYEKLSEPLDVVVILKDLPKEECDGLLVKIEEKQTLNPEYQNLFNNANYKFLGKAKTLNFDLEKIDMKLKEIESKISQKNQIIEEKNRDLDGLNLELKSLNEEIIQLETAFFQKQNQFNNIQEEFKKAEEELGIIVLELSEVDSQIKDLKEKETQLLNKDKEIQLAISNNEELLKRENENILSLDKKRETLLLEITKLKTEKDSLEEAIKKESQKFEVLENNLNELNQKLVSYKNQIEETKIKIEDLNKRISDLSSMNERLDKEMIEKIKLEETQTAKVKEKKEKLSEFKNKIEEYRNKIQESANRINELKMNLQDIDFKILNIKERIKQIYKIEWQEVSIPEGFNEEVYSLEINTLKERIDSLGTVNLVAMEEYEEFKTRYDFLTQQETDLINAKESLTKTIQKINQTAKSLFMDTFKLISSEFKNYFRLLFGGGDAQLFLIDENDPLESGVEIIARPPGKKLQNVSLLSGGEKALCAIALLFAIFKVKPSAFCILDEVDAALDEANISRYANLLDEFSKVSQFIVITHNKKTLLNADVMYGITMQESGVSKIVSVKFSDKKKKTEEDQKLTALV